MPLNSDGLETVRFIPERRGLKALFASPYSPARSDSIHEATLSVDAELTPDHGVIAIPVRLPRYLMPEWTQQQWGELISCELGFFHNFVDEAVVQGLSLAIINDKDRRAEVLRTANEVLIDFRGDLPNKYLPMMLGGYKIGVYRSGNNWPIWLSIQPTYDLAVKEATEIRDEAGLPKKSIVSVGALAIFLGSSLNLEPILSNRADRAKWTMWIVGIIAGVAGAIAWLMT